MVATTFHVVHRVLELDRILPSETATDSRWNRNAVSLLSSVTAAMCLLICWVLLLSVVTPVFQLLRCFCLFVTFREVNVAHMAG